MNWYQGEHDIQAKFGESEAGARRSNELRQLDELRVGRKSGWRAAISQPWSQLTSALAHIIRRKRIPRPSLSGSTHPRAARVYRKK